MKKSFLRLSSAALCFAAILLLLVGCRNSHLRRIYTVTFDLNGGELDSGELTQEVQEGESAQAPEAVNGKLQLSWDKDFSNITADTTVKAIWTKVPMPPEELAEYVQERTVTVNVTTITDAQSAGSGFFIDNQGTVVTNFHVIDMGRSISVQTSDGGNYSVQRVVNFSNVYDLAILKIDISGNKYLEFSDSPARTGEPVYAVGSPLGSLSGTFTSGSISSTNRSVSRIECIQTDAAISHGNSGGPLVNQYGDVVGINSFSYSRGESLNLAIKPEMLQQLGSERNFTVNEYTEWYIKEVSRSYSPYDSDGDYYYSLVNNYQTVTGVACVQSLDDDDEWQSGYRDMCQIYVYPYDVSSYDKYLDYLRSVGFVYDDHSLTSDGTFYTYVNSKDSQEMYILVNNDDALWISFFTS